MKTIPKLCLVGLLILCFILLGCVLGGVQSLTPEIKVTETESATIYVTPTPENAYTTPLGTATTLPVISLNNAKQILMQFVQANGGCKLPCILGIDPVRSNRDSAEAFIQYFAMHSQESNNQLDNLNIYSHSTNDGGGVRLVFWKNRIRVDVGVGVSFKENDIEYISLSTGVYEHIGELGNGSAKILSSNPYFDELLGHFSISHIFLEYGKPTEIWVYPFPEYLPDHPYSTSSYPFDFVLLYPDRGFAVEYIARVKESDGFLVGCPDTAYMEIASWNPTWEFGFAEISDFFEGSTDSINVSNSIYFRQIQDVTSMSVDDFYESYKNQSASECVKTPKDLWP